MLKLMKYEIRKQLFSKIIMLSLLMAFELVFIIGCINKQEGFAHAGIILISITAMIGIIYLLVETASIFENDLGKKQGYLLFMTPNSGYRIMGAKCITGVLSIAVAFCIFTGVISMNYALYNMRFTEAVVNPLEDTFNAYGDLGFTFREFLAALVAILLMWIFITTLFSLSISISYSFFGKGKLSSFLSVLLFIVIFLLEFIVVGILSLPLVYTKLPSDVELAIVGLVAGLLPAGLNFWITGWLLGKRVSL